MPTYLSRECQTADALWCACAGNTRSTCSEPPLIGLCVFHFLTSLLLIFLSCPLPLVIDIHLPLLDSAWFHVYLYLRQWKRPSKLLTEMLIGKIHSIFSGVFWEDMQCTAHINIPDKSMIQDIFHSCYVVIDDSLWGPRCGQGWTISAKEAGGMRVWTTYSWNVFVNMLPVQTNKKQTISAIQKTVIVTIWCP